VADRQRYELSGRAYVLAGLSSHAQQRATSRQIVSGGGRAETLGMHMRPGGGAGVGGRRRTRRGRRSMSRQQAGGGASCTSEQTELAASMTERPVSQRKRHGMLI